MAEIIEEDAEENRYFLCIQNRQPSRRRASVPHPCDFAPKYLRNHLCYQTKAESMGISETFT